MGVIVVVVFPVLMVLFVIWFVWRHLLASNKRRAAWVLVKDPELADRVSSDVLLSRKPWRLTGKSSMQCWQASLQSSPDF